jgi:hypothetical protein
MEAEMKRVIPCKRFSSRSAAACVVCANEKEFRRRLSLTLVGFTERLLA